ncbi:hypothetical protein GDO86_018868 [Hymenochirus boettgeri]|uniref:Uncharacterized protein n=1 Tax=Hymenochirus boettgeri TaxID=247094 RepID=A0A8T2ICW6_9PIPI|nr:hypothetical protein GDO86_018868 [Hymenochirus boettgeri]
MNEVEPEGTTQGSADTQQDDGMTWWYRWLCRLAGILGGLCSSMHQIIKRETSLGKQSKLIGELLSFSH